MSMSLSAFEPLLLTLKVACIATLLALVLGVAGGGLLSRAKFRGSDIIDAALALPLVLPPTVLGYYLLVLLGRNGVLGRWLHETFGVSLIFTWQGAVVAAAVAAAPLILKSARAALESVRGNMEHAARGLGAREMSVFLRISLPLAWRSILAGAMLAFARAMGEFGATLMIAGNLPGKTQTLSIAVYDAVQSGDNGRANLLVGITLVVCLAILYGSGKLFKSNHATAPDR